MQLNIVLAMLISAVINCFLITGSAFAQLRAEHLCEKISQTKEKFGISNIVIEHYAGKQLDAILNSLHQLQQNGLIEDSKVSLQQQISQISGCFGSVEDREKIISNTLKKIKQGEVFSFEYLRTIAALASAQNTTVSYGSDVSYKLDYEIALFILGFEHWEFAMQNPSHTLYDDFLLKSWLLWIQPESSNYAPAQYWLGLMQSRELHNRFQQSLPPQFKQNFSLYELTKAYNKWETSGQSGYKAALMQTAISEISGRCKIHGKTTPCSSSEGYDLLASIETHDALKSDLPYDYVVPSTFNYLGAMYWKNRGNVVKRSLYKAADYYTHTLKAHKKYNHSEAQSTSGNKSEACKRLRSLTKYIRKADVKIYNGNC